MDARSQLILTSITRFLTRVGWSGVLKLDLPDAIVNQRWVSFPSSNTRKYAATHVANKINYHFTAQISSHRRSNTQSIAQPVKITRVKLIIYQRDQVLYLVIVG